MIGIDANVLARFLLRDDPAQFDLAHDLLIQRCNTDTPGFVSVIVLCELVWVLKGRRVDKASLIAVLDDLLSAPQLRFEAEVQVFDALDQWRINNADFADILLALTARDYGCDTTYTFDRKAAQLDGVTLLER